MGGPGLSLQVFREVALSGPGARVLFGRGLEAALSGWLCRGGEGRCCCWGWRCVCAPRQARSGSSPCPQCACAAGGGWFERGGAAMAGPGPGLGCARSAPGLQRRGPGPAGVRRGRGRGGRPAAGTRRHRKAISSSPRPWSVRRRWRERGLSAPSGFIVSAVLLRARAGRDKSGL